MDEIREIHGAIKPHETLLVADAMTGQDAVNTGQAFHEKVGLTGIVLTRIDGDARGGAALSMRAVTGKPIKLIGVGEKIDALEDFHPDRIAGRILGMAVSQVVIPGFVAVLSAGIEDESDEPVHYSAREIHDVDGNLKRLRDRIATRP